MESAIIIIAIGLLVFLAHLFAVVFERSRVPDVLPLVLLGILIGPVFHLVMPTAFGQVGQVFTILALVIILYECGLNLDVDLLRKSFLLSVKLALLTFAATLVSTIWLSMTMLSLPLVQASILACIVAANSPSIVVPIISKLHIGENTKTTLVLETTVCEVLAIVCTLALIQVAQQQQIQPTIMIGEVVASFVLAAIIGVIAGFIWSSILKLIRQVENSVFCTPAFVCIVYGLSELFGYSGPVAALAFGFTLGNIKRFKGVSNFSILPTGRDTLTHTERTFFSAIVFLLKTFFFVYVGISATFNSMTLLGVAVILTVWNLIMRLVVTKFTLSKQFPTFDLAIISSMIPKGLTAIVLAAHVVQSHIRYALVLREISYGVVIFSICIVSLMIFLIEKGIVINFYRYVFVDKDDDTYVEEQLTAT